MLGFLRKRSGRSSIERKFILSIVWVGVIPMSLALIIGYVFAREGQQIAVQQNLATAARKTADGLRLAMKGRLRTAWRVANDPEVISALEHFRERGTLQLEPVLQRLKTESLHTAELESDFALYDAAATLLLSTDKLTTEVQRPEWVAEVHQPKFLGITYVPATQRYVAKIVSPVYHPATKERLGFLSETQGIDDLFQFIIGDVEGGDRYQLLNLTAGQEFVVDLDPGNPHKPLPPNYDDVDRSFAERLRSMAQREADTMVLWRYRVHRNPTSVLLAYHRLFPDSDLYIVIFRPTVEVFANINIAAALTLAISSLVIGIFCIIAYRIVNKNIIGPVSLLNEGAQIIRQGDLDLKLKIETGDEIEELAQSFNKMAAALRHNIAELEASEEKYRNLISAMRDAIFQTNAQGKITFINPAGVAILGYPSEDAVRALYLKDLFVDESVCAQFLREAMRNILPDRMRVWMKRADGQPLCVELSANRVVMQNHVFSGVEGTFRDITQNVKLEQEARERSERISVINQIARVINSSLEAGRVYESIAQEMQRLVRFDYASISLVTDQPDVVETLQLWPEPPEGVLASRQEEGSDSCAAWVMRERKCLLIARRDSPDLPVRPCFPPDIQSGISVPLYAVDRIIGTLNLGSTAERAFTRHDIEILEQLAPHVAVAIRNTELLNSLQQTLEEANQARERLREANEELKTLDEMKTNLLSNVSHELRTPLVSVMGYTEIILNEKVGPINDVQREYLKISLRNAERLVTLIENLLDFSRLHKGGESLVFDTFDLVECARSSLQVVRPVAERRQIQLELIAPEAPVLVEGDKNKLLQVFNNLYSNAIKFNRNGGKVTTEIRVREDSVEVAVSDTGIGIPEDALDKIFTRFYQVDSSSTRKYGGTGIGLAIAQDIIRMHGSRITVTSKLGEGSTFRFVLPRSRAHTPVTEPAKPSLLPTETHQLIELVTQDRSLSILVRNMLVSEGMDVIHAAHPNIALSLAHKYNPDCILVDTEAGPLGSVVLEDMLNDPAAYPAPIVLLTDDDALFERYRHVVAGRIRRSFRKSTLLSGIHSALTRPPAIQGQLGHKILCVDDDPEILSLLQAMLSGEGWSVDTCTNGEEAIALARSGAYWLVLLDVAMPDMNGFEVCQKIKAEMGVQGIRVYFITAKPIEQSGVRWYEYGADGYLIKPFKREELVAVIQEMGQTLATT